MTIKITPWCVPWESDPILESLMTLRRNVFVDEQSCPLDEEPDSNDPNALHVCAIHDGYVVGCARILVTDEKTAKIGRVAVSKSVRRSGVGSFVMTAAINYARTAGFVHAYIESQTHAIPFYESFGFSAYGPVFDDCNIPHRKMKLDL